MGQLQRGVFTHPDTGRDAGKHRILGGADGGGGPRLIVVSVQVHHADEPPAHRAAAEGALHVEQALGMLRKDPAAQIAGHGIVDLHDVGLHTGAVQAAFGQDEPQGGGIFPHPVLHPLPVLRLGRILVAGHDAPQSEVAVLGQEDICRLERQAVKGMCHSVHSFLGLVDGYGLLFSCVLGLRESSYTVRSRSQRRCSSCF